MVSVWGAAGKTRLRSLQTLQNRCLKAVYRKPRLYSTLELFRQAESSILPVAALRELQSLVQIQNLLHNPLAHHNQTLSQLSHGYSTRNQSALLLKRPRTECGKKSFDYYAKKQHNDLPVAIKTIRNISKFKKQLLLHIRTKLNSYLYWVKIVFALLLISTPPSKKISSLGVHLLIKSLEAVIVPPSKRSVLTGGANRSIHCIKVNHSPTALLTRDPLPLINGLTQLSVVDTNIAPPPPSLLTWNQPPLGPSFERSVASVS